MVRCAKFGNVYKKNEIFSKNFKTRSDLIKFDLITILLDDHVFENVLNLA